MVCLRMGLLVLLIGRVWVRKVSTSVIDMILRSEPNFLVNSTSEVRTHLDHSPLVCDWMMRVGCHVHQCYSNTRSHEQLQVVLQVVHMHVQVLLQ